MDIRDVKDFMIQLNEDASIKHQLDELSKDKLGTYLAKAHFDREDADNNKNNWLEIKALENQGKYIQAGNLQKLSDIMGKKYRKRSIGMKLAAKHLLAKEDVDQLDELSKAKLQDYLVGASMNKSFLSYDLGRHQGENYGRYISGDKTAHNDLKYIDALNKKHGNRSAGLQIAASKLAGNGPNRYLRTKVPATEDVDQLKSSVKENFEFKDLISLNESYRSIFK